MAFGDPPVVNNGPYWAPTPASTVTTTWTWTGNTANVPYGLHPVTVAPQITTFPPFAPPMGNHWEPIPQLASACSCKPLGYEIPEDSELNGFCPSHGVLKVTQIKVH